MTTRVVSIRPHGTIHKGVLTGRELPLYGVEVVVDAVDAEDDEPVKEVEASPPGLRVGVLRV